MEPLLNACQLVLSTVACAWPGIPLSFSGNISNKPRHLQEHMRLKTSHGQKLPPKQLRPMTTATSGKSHGRTPSLDS